MTRKRKHSSSALRAGQLAAPDAKAVTLPERVLYDFSKRYPGLWRQVEDVRSDPQYALGIASHWHPWCYLPVNVASSCLAELKRSEYSLREVEILFTLETRLACALAAWRMTKGVYSFDPDVLEELLSSEARDGLPEEVFLRMPDWCVYIPTPGVTVLNTPMYGFFAWVDDHFIGTDMRRKAPELNFEILLDPRTAPDVVLLYSVLARPALNEKYESRLRRGKSYRDALPRDSEYVVIRYQVELTHGSFTEATLQKAVEAAASSAKARESLSRMGHEVAASLFQQRSDAATQKIALQEMTETLIRLANLVLYLCAEEADIAPEGVGARRKGVARLQAQDVPVDPALRVRKWDVGYRVGTALRLARQANEGDVRESGTGPSPRPHVRRAHWHTFLYGPRDGEQIRKVKWLPPIPVRVSDPDDLVPTLHQVDTPPPSKPDAAAQKEGA